MNGKKMKPPTNPLASRSTHSKDDTQIMISPSRLPSRPCDSIPSLSSFLTAESDRSVPGGLAPCYSSPSLPTRNHPSFSDTERDVHTVDSGFPATYNGAEDGELDGIYEEEELCSVPSDLFSSSSNMMAHVASSNDDETLDTPDFHSIQIFGTSTSAIDKISGDGEVSYAYSLKKSRERPKRKLSNWYQVKRETFVKSYRDKVNHFKKTFDGTPVDTDRFLVDYSCALVKNKNGLLLLGRMYITDKWICFYSKIIYELKIYLAVDDIETVSKAKTARLIPNAIQITMKSNKERYFFTSFSSRERTFAFLKKVCENSRNGGVGNMEELLCQVQDVYGDESLAVLDFEDGDDDDVYPPNRSEQVTSTTELTDIPSIDSVDGSLNNSMERVEVKTLTRHRRPQFRYNPRNSKNHLPRAATEGETSIPLDRPHRSVSSTHLPPTTTIGSLASSYDLSEESESTINSIDSIEEDGKGGIEMNFDKKQRERTAKNGSGCGRLQKKASKPPVIQRRESALDNTGVPRGRSSSAHSKKSANANDLLDSGLGEETHLNPVSCGSGHKHPGRTYAAVDINVSVDALFTLLFTDSQFFSEFCEHRGTFDLRQKPWPTKPWVDNGKDIHRNISYVLTLKQRFGPRTCRAFESQTILLSETRPGMRYIVDASVTNEAVPLCNSFHVTTRYCLLRRSATVSHLIITSEVIYDRPVFFGAKSIIESTCRSNLTDNFTDLVDHLTKASQNLTERERITGGALARPCRPKEKKILTNLPDKSCPANCSNNGKNGLESSSAGSDDQKYSISDISTAKGGVIGHYHHSTRGLSIPQVLLYPNEQSEGRWLFFIAIFGLCVLLSMIYNRYQNVERITADHLEYTARAAIRPGSAPTSCCEELDSIRLLINSVSGVLSQMRTTLNLLERRLDQLSNKACKTTAENIYFGH
ncbi:unnamed protein product [Hymenolepis diminuta]|uniref:VASt domain-containing protein n=1 Tax=Hymenolepis diminuta TaxID=6216 RepID=A0A564YFK5_HYMDI|nr:unnamed protein product [Hymenolepis diminuta]